MTTLIDFEATTITGKDQRLADYLGKVVLVVNTASKCGLTPQFEGLEKLYGDLREQGLVVLGFPCDQFANQEFDNDAETAEFCQMNYGVSFPMFAKVDVNGGDAHPLFAWLRNEPVSTCNIQSDDSADVKPGAKAVDAQAGVALPVRDGHGAVRAVVGIAYRDEKTLGADELAALEAAAATLP